MAQTRVMAHTVTKGSARESESASSLSPRRYDLPLVEAAIPMPMVAAPQANPVAVEAVHPHKS